MRRNIERPTEASPPPRQMAVAWRWTNQFGKEVITSNHHFAQTMMGLFAVEPLVPQRQKQS